MALQSQPVGILGHVGDRVRRARDEECSTQDQRRGGDPRDDDERSDADGADDRHPRRSVSPDQGRGGQSGDQCARGERGDRCTVDRVGQMQIGLDLGVARQQIGEDRPVAQEQRRDRDAGPPVLRRGHVERFGRHVPDTTDPGL